MHVWTIFVGAVMSVLLYVALLLFQSTTNISSNIPVSLATDIGFYIYTHVQKLQSASNILMVSCMYDNIFISGVMQPIFHNVLHQ